MAGLNQRRGRHHLARALTLYATAFAIALPFVAGVFAIAEFIAHTWPDFHP